MLNFCFITLNKNYIKITMHIKIKNYSSISQIFIVKTFYVHYCVWSFGKFITKYEILFSKFMTFEKRKQVVRTISASLIALLFSLTSFIQVQEIREKQKICLDASIKKLQQLPLLSHTPSREITREGRELSTPLMKSKKMCEAGKNRFFLTCLQISK